MDKKLYKLNPKNNVFEIFPGFEDVSIIFQDEDLIYWIGTYSNGLYRFDPKIGSPDQVLSTNEINRPIYNISNDSNGNIVMATNGLLIEFNKKSQSFSYLSFKDSYGEDIHENFSDMVTDNQGRLWISTFGDGLYFRDSGAKMLQRLSNTNFTDPLPSNLNILDIHLDKKG
ncbi:MAG: two-component regulator propeller domain-containing protein, partial [Flavobacteriaceae bacterium]